MIDNKSQQKSPLGVRETAMAPRPRRDQLGSEGDPKSSEIHRFDRYAANELLRP